ncbi:DUF1684 domain-containing protein [Flavobacterium suncheonense]|uniref:DUF1684 domain-containing protein n=1 Tax=Flavobacterium suncheonense GH29-5 = DSM 17707 TaxID=1121899 RepID=A0A0A2MRD7_9FLAO|nr:DUF1684 domain-containing protein [Flavobacterium suncheonense]KGO90815.1 hypothetical protein Q764_01470 [Flavobacterium suncheonense GH29-5 = DSM 17707]
MKKILLMLLLPVAVSAQCSVEISKAFQNQLNKEYADEKESPLKKEDLVHFSGLDFYDINGEFCVEARLTRTPKEKPFVMPTSGTRKPLYVKYGELEFMLQGKKCNLNVYRNIELSKMEKFKNHLFLPFTDLTSGVESYGGGRYIDLEATDKDTVIIDFNQAYNPYCAYNEGYSCPIPPKENDLLVEVRAGVKKFHD